jgi:rhodanese-related sulfurtransferase
MRALFVQAGVLVVLSAAGGWLSFRHHPEAPALYLHLETRVAEGEVSLAMVRELEAAGGVLWIDARVRSEYEREHVPGAVLLNEQEWEQLMFEAVETLSRNDKPVVIYCDAQRCDASHRLAEKLRDIGQPDVRVLAGGWQAWKSGQAR